MPHERPADSRLCNDELEHCLVAQHQWAALRSFVLHNQAWVCIKASAHFTRAYFCPETCAWEGLAGGILGDAPNQHSKKTEQVLASSALHVAGPQGRFVVCQMLCF